MFHYNMCVTRRASFGLHATIIGPASRTTAQQTGRHPPVISRPTASADDRRPDLADMEREALETALVARGHERFRGRQVFEWIHAHGVTDPAAMTNLPARLRSTLASEFRLTTPQIQSHQHSAEIGRAHV